MGLGLLAASPGCRTRPRRCSRCWAPRYRRDLILILGGLFLLFKGTMELHERVEGAVATTAWAEASTRQPGSDPVIVLDAVFSLTSVITAVGMVQDLDIMMTGRRGGDGRG